MPKRTKRSTLNVQQSDAATLVNMTRPGMVLGAVGYMSPERVRGLALTSRHHIGYALMHENNLNT